MPAFEIRALATPQVGPLSLEVAAGACAALWGPSGAGKTLLLRACADLDPHEGEVALDGRTQSGLSGPEWRSLVGLLPAESAWWADNVRPHFPGGRHDALVEALGLPAAALDWEVRRLSTGERQRLALARLLARRPHALLLDEPTANLDPDATALVEALVDSYRRREEAPVLWVSHDTAQRGRVASDSYRLERGRLARE